MKKETSVEDNLIRRQALLALAAFCVRHVQGGLMKRDAVVRDAVKRNSNLEIVCD